MLNDRAQILLKTLVDRYISDGQPVGSRALQQYSGLDVSPATIRNVMADLEEMGLVLSRILCRPHPRAGYRLFIDTDGGSADSLAQTESHSRTPRLPPRLPTCRPSYPLRGDATPKRAAITVRQIEFLRLSDRRVLLIIVMPDGEVENRVLLTHKDYTQSQLSEAGNFLSQHYADCAFQDIHQRMQGELHQLQHELHALMSAAMAASDAAMARRNEDYVISGESKLLHINDLSSNMDKLRGLFNVFEQKTELLHLLDAGRHAPGVHIFVGKESGLAELDECSVVSAPLAQTERLSARSR
jgi:heat-inducible transcriptional repressor